MRNLLSGYCFPVLWDKQNKLYFTLYIRLLKYWEYFILVTWLSVRVNILGAIQRVLKVVKCIAVLRIAGLELNIHNVILQFLVLFWDLYFVIVE